MPRRNHRRCREQSKTRTRREKKKDKGNGREDNISLTTELLTIIRKENRQNRELGFKKSTICRGIISWLEDSYDSRGGDRFVQDVFDSAMEVGQSFHRECDQFFYKDAVMVSVTAFLLWDDARDHLQLIERIGNKLADRLQDDAMLGFIERKIRARKNAPGNNGERPSAGADCAQAQAQPGQL